MNGTHQVSRFSHIATLETLTSTSHTPTQMLTTSTGTQTDILPLASNIARLKQLISDVNALPWVSAQVGVCGMQPGSFGIRRTGL